MSRKIYDRVGAGVVAPAVGAPDRVPGVLDREERRDFRDAQRRSNAARILFKQFWDRMTIVDIDVYWYIERS